MSRPRKSTRKLEFVSLLEDNSLCPVATLTECMSRTEGLRKSASSEETRLFISFIKPHKAMSTATVARWIKSVLSAAGIDTSVFKPHSVRGASVTINMSKVFQSLTFFVWLTGGMSTRLSLIHI